MNPGLHDVLLSGLTVSAQLAFPNYGVLTGMEVEI